MFYCRECRIKNEWPESFSGSYGKCEICGNTASCYDVPSSALPIPKRQQADLLRSEISYTQQKILELKQLIQRKQGALKSIEVNCQHQWEDPVLSTVHCQRTWSRTCKSCGITQLTGKASKTVREEPVFEAQV